MERAEVIIGSLAAEHAKHWSAEMLSNPAQLLRAVMELLVDVRLACRRDGTMTLLPAAARFRALERHVADPPEAEQHALF